MYLSHPEQCFFKIKEECRGIGDVGVLPLPQSLSIKMEIMLCFLVLRK